MSSRENNANSAPAQPQRRTTAPIIQPDTSTIQRLPAVTQPHSTAINLFAGSIISIWLQSGYVRPIGRQAGTKSRKWQESYWRISVLQIIISRAVLNVSIDTQAKQKLFSLSLINAALLLCPPTPASSICPQTSHSTTPSLAEFLKSLCHKSNSTGKVIYQETLGSEVHLLRKSCWKGCSACWFLLFHQSTEVKKDASLTDG